jgi:hypothetical protein
MRKASTCPSHKSLPLVSLFSCLLAQLRNGRQGFNLGQGPACLKVISCNLCDRFRRDLVLAVYNKGSWAKLIAGRVGPI